MGDQQKQLDLVHERDEAWRLSRLERRKLISVGYSKIVAVKDVQDFFEKKRPCTRLMGKQARAT